MNVGPGQDPFLIGWSPPGVAMHCPNCRHANTPTANFCAQCGSRLRTAPAVQDALLASSREPLLTSTEGENRIVTVMFADMSSSVKALGDLDPEDAAALVSELLAAMVEVLLKYEGRVDRFLGDGLLAVFGAPRAHESDPERAIYAALEIRQAAGELGLQVTVGINTGRVYFGEIGSERHHEVTVMGSVVNLASRLQAKAEPGQILVGEATYRHTRRAFEFAPLTLEVKGVDRLVAAYSVVRALPRSERGRDIEGLQAELIGRDGELAALDAVLQKVLQGQGQMVSLIAEAGLGKSRLVSELKLAVLEGRRGRESEIGPGRFPLPAPPTPSTVLWLEGRCLELGTGTSYWLFLDLFRGYFKWRFEDDDRVRRERILTSLREFVERGNLSEERAAEMEVLLGNLFSIGSGDGEAEPVRSARPEQVKHQTFLAIRDFFVALAGRQPVVLVCEDLHWADSLSLDLIGLLIDVLAREGRQHPLAASPPFGVRRVPGLPLLLLCVYRPEDEHKCRQLETLAVQKCPERYTELRLQELTPVQSRRLVESLLSDEDLPFSAKDRILEKSRGNPFFVEEIIRSLIESGMIYREAVKESCPQAETGPEPPAAAGAPVVGSSFPIGGVWRARPGFEKMTVPERVESVILSRVDRLEPELKQVLQTAAVIGRLFHRSLLEAMMRAAGDGAGQPLSSEGWERALWELEDRWLIHRERILPEEEYSFRHVLVQETIYESLLHRRRSVLHQQAAEAIENLYQANLPEYYGQLAYHYQLSHADEKAVEYLLKAGEKARSSYLNDEAVAYFQQALERLNRPSGGAPSSRLQAPGGIKGRAASRPATHRAWSLEPGAWSRSAATSRLAALTGLGQVHLGVGEIVEAEQCFRQAILVGQEIGLPPRELVRLYFRLGDVLYWHNQWDELIRIGEEGLSLLGEDTNSVEAALMNHIAAVGYSKRQPEKHWELSHRNAQFLQDLPYSEELRPVFYTVAGTYRRCDRNAQEALKWMEALERRAEQHHDVRALVDAAFFRGDLLLEQGDLEGAIRAEQQGREQSRRIGDIKSEAWCLGMMGRAFLALGDLQQAEARSREALEIMVGDESDIAHTLMVVATVSLCRGSWEAAAAAFERAAQLFRGVGSADAAWAACALGRVFLARGERREGLRQFQEAIHLAKGDVSGLAAALRGLEEAYNDPESFRAFCDRFRKEHSEEGDCRLVQWFLRPAEIGRAQHPRVHDAFADRLSPDWIWEDPFADCSTSVQQGLAIHAANGRDLGGLNRSGPRLVRQVGHARRGSLGFAVETVCTPATGEKPALGGILCWRDAGNFLRLDRGTGGKHEITFMGCVGNRDLIVGRGRLSASRVVLRMEQREGGVSCLCSVDGRDWFSLGEVEFGAVEPMQVGLYASGRLDRTLYPRAYRKGTAIRFESFRLWH